MNDTGPVCRRCRADLVMCFAVEEQRENAVAAARAVATEGRLRDAIDLARVAGELRRGIDADQLLATLYLIAGDFTTALSYGRQRC
jgi:hypothetical protein